MTRQVLPPLAAAILLFGAAWPVTRAALDLGATPIWMAFARSALAAAVLAAALALLGRLRRPARADLPAILLVGIPQLTLFFALANAGAGLAGAARTGILSNATLLFVPFLSLLALPQEPVRARTWAATATAALGVALLAGPWAIDWRASGALAGHGLLLAAALAWAMTLVGLRRWPPAAPTFDLLPWAALLSALLLGPLALLLEPHGGIPLPAWPHALAVGALVATLGTAALTDLSRRVPAARAAILLLAVPLTGAVVAHLWLGEPIGWPLAVGGLLIGAGVALAARR